MSEEIRAEMTGSVWKIVSNIGDVLKPEDSIMILESMKMEIPVETESGGTLAALHVGEGESVIEGQLLATLD